MTGELAYRGVLQGLPPTPSDDWGAWASPIEFDLALARGEAPHVGPPIEHWRHRLSAMRLNAVSFGYWQAPSVEPPDDPIGGPIAEAWRSVKSGDAFPSLEGIIKAARSRQLADLVVECSVLRALAAEAEGDLNEALRQARRASIMARNEALPQSEYLAGIVLARMRRRTGYPHLALQILRTLSEVASPHWAGWIAWERTLAGESQDHPMCAILRSYVDAIAAADEGHFESIDELARGELASFAQRDVRVVRGLLEVAQPAMEDAPVGYAPLVGAIHLACWPNQPSRLVGQHGLALAGLPTFFDSAGKKRIVALVAALGTHGELESSECFQQVYGFPFIPEVHAGTFDVLVHRARKSLKPVAEIERGAEGIRMTVNQPFAVCDPRHAEPQQARLLRVLATGGQTAVHAAQAAGLSLRQAQAILKALADDGLCVAHRNGRTVEYSVEDTCFSSPTRRP